jgi:hypothetical protein
MIEAKDNTNNSIYKGLDILYKVLFVTINNKPDKNNGNSPPENQFCIKLFNQLNFKLNKFVEKMNSK